MCLYLWQFSPRFASLSLQLRFLFEVRVKLDLCVGEIFCLLPWIRLAVNLASVGGTFLVCLGWCKDDIAALGIMLRNGKYNGLLINVSPAFGLFVGYADEGTGMLLGHGFNFILNAWRRREAITSM